MHQTGKEGVYLQVLLAAGILKTEERTYAAMAFSLYSYRW
jgi:hypothetical protein